MRRSRAFAALVLAGITAGLAALLPAREPAAGPMPPARHERRDIGFRPMLLAGTLLLIAVGGMMGLAYWIYPRSLQDQTFHRPLPRFPEPQLQPNPPGDMEAFRALQLKQLRGTYWLDREAGRLHLPIDQAMAKVARDGIPDWPGR